jgi:hypothetical protein
MPVNVVSLLHCVAGVSLLKELKPSDVCVVYRLRVEACYLVIPNPETHLSANGVVWVVLVLLLV